MKLSTGSHLDHALSEAQLAWVLERFAARLERFAETVELPEALGTVLCGLHGPVMGDPPVTEAEVHYAQRGQRPGVSRLCKRAPRATRVLTVIAGPSDGEPCVLYTAFGGPLAPKEPWDQRLQGNEEAHEASKRFWAEHALSE